MVSGSAVQVSAILNLIVALGLSVGVLLAAFGWRGRRVSDHPHCRRCGFDLHGSLDGHGRTPESCPECGRSLRGVRGVRSGLWRTRPALLGVGVFLVLVGLGAIGTRAYIAQSNVNLNVYKPAWLLRYEAGRHGTRSSVAALDELIARLHAARLGQPAVDGLVAEGMQLQADPTASWEPRWGEIVEYAREQGMVSDTDWHQYIKTAAIMSLSLEVRPRVMIGDPIYQWVRKSRARLSDSHRRWHFQRGDHSFQIDGIEDPTSRRVRSSSGGSLSGRHGGGASGRGFPFNREVWGGLGPGTHEVKRVVSIEISEVASGGGEPIGPPFLAFDHELTGTLELTAEPTVRAVVDGSMRDPVSRSIRAEEFRVASGSGWDHVTGSIDLARPPVGLAFRVYLRDGRGREVDLGTINEGPNDRTSYHVSAEQPDWGAWTEPTGDVVLRPDEEAAKRSSDVFDYWNEEVVIEGVPVELPAPSASDDDTP